MIVADDFPLIHKTDVLPVLSPLPYADPGIPVDAGVPTSASNKTILVLSGIGLMIALLSEKKKVGKVERKDIWNFVLIAGVVLSFDVIKKILTSLGIWKSNETKQLDSQATDPNSFWNPNFYKQFNSYTYAINTNQATDYAKRIYESFGFFNDCEECVKAVFYELKTKSNVSFLSKIFQDIYGQALLPFLRGGIWPQDRLSDSDVSELNNYISKLPNN